MIGMYMAPPSALVHIQLASVPCANSAHARFFSEHNPCSLSHSPPLPTLHNGEETQENSKTGTLMRQKSSRERGGASRTRARSGHTVSPPFRVAVLRRVAVCASWFVHAMMRCVFVTAEPLEPALQFFVDKHGNATTTVRTRGLSR